MRSVPQALGDHLAQGATTLCHCWRVVRRNGVTLGFTDHDCDLDFAGVTHSARAGLEASRMETPIGMAAGGGEVSGVLDAQTLRETDLANGLYDGARVEIWRVNWADVTQRLLLDIATVGEVRRNGAAFNAELRSLAAALDQEQGRLYQGRCNADLGDARCGVQLDAPNLVAQAQLVTPNEGRVLRFAPVAAPDAWFSGGQAIALDGDQANARFIIEDHGFSGEHTLVRLWREPAQTLPAGLAMRLVAGCDKRFATCRDKFTNHRNFRGFPHIPGADVLMSHAVNGVTVFDGGSLFR